MHPHPHPREQKPVVNIGERLCHARTQRNISLADASAATKLKVVYIEAMENNRFDELPAPVYAKNFIKMYGKYLGLDGAQLSDEFGKRTSVEIDLPPAVETPTTYHVSLALTQVFRHKIMLFAGGLLLLLLLLYFAQRGSSNGTETTVPAERRPVDTTEGFQPVFDTKEPLPKIE